MRRGCHAVAYWSLTAGLPTARQAQSSPDVGPALHLCAQVTTGERDERRGARLVRRDVHFAGQIAPGRGAARRMTSSVATHGSTDRAASGPLLPCQRLERVEDIGQRINPILVRAQVARVERGLCLVIEALCLGHQASRV